MGTGSGRPVGWLTGGDGAQLLSDAMRVETKIVNDDNESLRPRVFREGGRIFHSYLGNAEKLGTTFYGDLGSGAWRGHCNKRGG